MKKFSLKKTNGHTLEQIHAEINAGGKFVTYGYCISVVAFTYRLISSPHFIKAGETNSKYRSKYNLLSLIFGWWGFPWGPIHTIEMVRVNMKTGGVDITDEIMEKDKFPASK
ncbi:MAG: hypothetical protein MUC87_18245 [Bacteroidia bacterium]|jgi:hypothetical protein|nr:hypothetical protein [Bacteroidia bacterium]